MNRKIGQIKRLQSRRASIDAEIGVLLRALRAEGHTVRGIGKALGVNHAQVVRWSRIGDDSRPSEM